MSLARFFAFCLLLAVGATLPAAEDTATARRVIDEVLADPAFGTTRTEHEWEYVGEPWEWKSSGRSGGSVDLSGLGAVLALGAEILLWTLVVFAVVWLIINRGNFAGLLALRRAVAPHRMPRPARSGALPVTETLPPDVAGAAWQAWQAGRHRDALSLLFRGALACLESGGRLHLRVAATEEECVRAVAADVKGELAGYFARLSRVWQQVAYARRLPSDADVEALCGDWRRHFEAARDEV